jgi:hypothetical protein
MDIKLGLVIKLRDPDNPANVVKAQFATIRSCPEMEVLLRECARTQVAETAAIRKYQLALDEIDAAETPQAVDDALAKANSANEARLDAGNALLAAIHAFVVRGFVNGGADQENAERLASIVGPEDLAELKMKCQFGSGVVDFTRTGAQSS